MRTAVVRQTGVACLSQIELMPDRQEGQVYQNRDVVRQTERQTEKPG